MLPNFKMFEVSLEAVFNWLSMSQNDLAAIVLAVFFAVFVMLELRFPKVAISLQAWRQSYRANISLFIFNSSVLSLLAIPSLVLLADKYADHGLLNMLPVSASLWKAILAFLLLDMILYFWHRACHSFDFLWNFHKVHHSDADLNVSTAFRVHIIEVFIGVIIKAAYIIALGVDKVTIITYEAMITFFVMMHHANITLPAEKLLGRLFIVPSLHRVHHSMLREEHDRNYGSVLSIWDRFLGSLAQLDPEAIGIKGNPPLGFINLLKFGFSSGVQHPLPEPKLKAMIADAAYFKALNRGFTKDHELDDWLQAERDIFDSMSVHPSAKQGFRDFFKNIPLPVISIFPKKCSYGV